MEIFNNLGVENINIKNQKGLNQLSVGDKFKALIMDIKQDSISIKLSDNSIINAKSLTIPEARIGQSATFMVKENSSGQILLEIVKQSSNNPSIGFSKELLQQLNIPVTKQNISLIENMISNNVELSNENIQKALFFNYSDKNISLDKVMFLLKENMPANEVSIKVLDDIVQNNTNLKDEFLMLSEKISNMPESDIKSKLLNLFDVNNNVHTPIKKQINNKLFLNIRDEENITQLNKHFNYIKEISNKAEKIVTKNYDDISKTFKNIEDDIDFINHINNYKQYIQIPFYDGNTNNQAELYVFKEKKGKNNYNESASILLSLDFSILGHIESFINKVKNNLSFQFKLKDENIIKIFKSNIKKLNEMLSEKGYTISSIDFKKLDEPFNITMDNYKNENREVKNRRFSFDMRV